MKTTYPDVRWGFCLFEKACLFKIGTYDGIATMERELRVDQPYEDRPVERKFLWWKLKDGVHRVYDAEVNSKSLNKVLETLIKIAENLQGQCFIVVYGKEWDWHPEPEIGYCRGIYHKTEKVWECGKWLV